MGVLLQLSRQKRLLAGSIEVLSLAKAPATVYVCQNCGYQSRKWLGKCPDCAAWTSFVEERTRVAAAIENLQDDHAGTLSDEAGEETAYDNHLADTATETYDRELDYSLEENSEHVLAEIDAALKRIEDGTYGICTNRGEQIPVERLEARPYATLCIDCQRERER